MYLFECDFIVILGARKVSFSLFGLKEFFKTDYNDGITFLCLKSAL